MLEKYEQCFNSLDGLPPATYVLCCGPLWQHRARFLIDSRVTTRFETFIRRELVKRRITTNEENETT